MRSYGKVDKMKSRPATKHVNKKSSRCKVTSEAAFSSLSSVKCALLISCDKQQSGSNLHTIILTASLPRATIITFSPSKKSDKCSKRCPKTIQKALSHTKIATKKAAYNSMSLLPFLFRRSKKYLIESGAADLNKKI